MIPILREAGIGMAVMLGCFALFGCAGTGEVVTLDVKPTPPARSRTETEPIRVVIEPFDDRRGDTNRMGMRTHLWGGVTYFAVKGDKPADIVTRAVAEALEQRGALVTVNAPGSVRVEGEPDVILTGRLLDFATHAKSRFMSTVLTTKTKFVVQAKNAVDRSTVTRDVESIQDETIFWFNNEDVQRALEQTLKEDRKSVV